MSNPASQPSPPASPVQQQLDELDALLQRMLALPVNQLEDLAPPLEAFVTADMPEPPLPDQPPALLDAAQPFTVLVHPQTEPDEPPAPAPLPPVNEIPLFAASRLAPLLAMQQVPEESPAVGRIGNPSYEEPQAEVVESTARSVLSPESSEGPADAPASQEPTPESEPAPASAPLPASLPVSSLPDMPLPLWLLPLGWVNSLFERLTFPLGLAGRWLRHPQGRGVLGWAGVAMLAVALAWLMLDWIGWTW